MEDDEDYDRAGERCVSKPSRVQRAIKVLQHDTGKSRTDEIVEMTQIVLDDKLEDNSSKNIAFLLKRKLDSAYGGTWHVIVGKHFGGNVTSDAQTLVNYSIDGVYYLVLRSGPPERSSIPPEEISGAQNTVLN